MGHPQANDLTALGTTVTSPEQRHRAALYVAGKATDTDDARTLLDMLGLREAS